MQKSGLIFLLLLGVQIIVHAQNTDSLWKQYQNTRLPDTTRLSALGSMAKAYLQRNPDSAIVLLKIHVKHAHRIGNTKEEANAVNYIGLACFNKGDYPNSMRNHLKALKLFEKINYIKGIGFVKMNVGNIYIYQGDLDKALSHYESSLEYFIKCKAAKFEALAYDNIAVVYANKNDFDKALEYFKKENEIYKIENNERGQANCLGNIGAIYSMREDYDRALENHRLSLDIRRKIKDYQGIGVCYINLGGIGSKRGDYQLAVSYLDSCVNLSKKTQDARNLQLAYEGLAGAYGQWKHYKEAYEYQKLFKEITDSLFNLENSKQIGDLKTDFEVAKKAAQLKAEQEKKDAIAAADAKRQRIILFAISGFGILVLGFAVFILRNLRVTRRQKSIIEKQKLLVEEKHKEITDSINYAERIQRSFLATREILDSNLNSGNYFVFFRPKDVVSGDFYWAANLADKSFVYATADSTGHGVPGAIMSILNISSLERAIENHSSPDEILNATRKIIIDRLRKDGSAEGGKDGMDCSLVILDKNRRQLHYASANNPVWIIRGNQLIEYPADKMPVGRHDRDRLVFTRHTVELQPGDTIYTFTDGMPDQFGGPNGKKFKYARLKEFLLGINQLSMQQQFESLGRELESWKGNLEQVDDILVLGVRI